MNEKKFLVVHMKVLEAGFQGFHSFLRKFLYIHR